jgi:isoprenylcysteine carboxyl methyltransferase (ICMT) family protein YpbQ
MTIPYIFIACFFIRIISLGKSIYNEKKLRSKGAIEYGKTNSSLLTIAHVLFYYGCIHEAIYLHKQVNLFSYVGIWVFTFSMIILWWVIITLGNIWTVKLIISPGQTLKSNFLFKHVKHPNYFLNVIPELISIALICNAWHVLFIGLPMYMVPLTIRIAQEEKIMKEKFKMY